MKYLLILCIVFFLSTAFDGEKNKLGNKDQKFIDNVQLTLEKGIEYFH